MGGKNSGRKKTIFEEAKQIRIRESGLLMLQAFKRGQRMSHNQAILLMARKIDELERENHELRS